MRGEFGFADLRSSEDDVARAAARLSPPDAAWIIPPELEMFRVLSGRTVVANFTAIPFDDGAMRSWRQRMKDLYGDTTQIGFRGLAQMKAHYASEGPAAAAAHSYDAPYAVLYRATPWPGQVLYQNEDYKAVRLFR